MAFAESHDHTLILKTLSGAQAGVEVALADGEYTLGSGQDDDLQFVDVCLKSGHARIRIDNGKVFVTGGAGILGSQSGWQIEAGNDDWHELSDLEIITIGANRFAFGPVDADWSSVAAAMDGESAAQGPKRGSQRSGAALFRYGLAASTLLIGVVTAIWFLFGAFVGGSSFVATAQDHDLDAVREALNRFPFGESVDLRQEADDVIFAAGYVNEPAERRALRTAVNETGVPVNLRLWVLSVIRTQLDAAVESFEVDVTYELSDDGAVSLTGEILPKETAERFLTYVRTEIGGLAVLESDIRTAETYFEEIRDLARRSGIGDSVIMRLADDRVEASGVVVSERLDLWVGFLQAYASRYADRIPLTSYVQLANDQGEVVAETGPTRLGLPGLPAEEGTTDLDLELLKAGEISTSDLFGPPEPVAGRRAQQGSGSEGARTLADPVTLGGATAVRQESLAQGARVLMSLPDEKQAKPPVAEVEEASGSAEEETGTSGDRLQAAGGTAKGHAATGQAPTGQAATGQAATEPSGTRQEEADNLRARDSVAERVLSKWDSEAAVPDISFRKRYLPLVLTPAAAPGRCWPGSTLTHADIPAVLFWLDYLSLSRDLSLVEFDIENQHLLLEAALNPSRLRQCASSLAQQRSVPFNRMSYYLDETEHNPNFVHYLVRDFVPPSLNIAGVMLRENGRFIQMPDGTKLPEGSSPNVESKLVSVGALGALLQGEDRLIPIVYPNNLAWKLGK